MGKDNRSSKNGKVAEEEEAEREEKMREQEAAVKNLLEMQAHAEE